MEHFSQVEMAKLGCIPVLIPLLKTSSPILLLNILGCLRYTKNFKITTKKRMGDTREVKQKSFNYVFVIVIWPSLDLPCIWHILRSETSNKRLHQIAILFALYGLLSPCKRYWKVCQNLLCVVHIPSRVLKSKICCTGIWRRMKQIGLE